MAMGDTVLLIGVVLAYFAVLLVVSHYVAPRDGGNGVFFTAGRRSPWWLVAIGMVSASVSGVSVVSVPGMVGVSGFSYLQAVCGFFFGYLVVAYVLLPVYYERGVSSIYSLLGERLGVHAERTGSLLFVVAKVVMAATKLYVAALLVHRVLFGDGGVPFGATVCVLVLVIWVYTRRGGIRSLILTDCIQTVLLVVALVFIVGDVMGRVDGGMGAILAQMGEREECRMFVWEVGSAQNFFKEFLGGVFIVIAMTGVDQDLMQKNLTCRTLRASQRNMLTYGSLFLPLNLVVKNCFFASCTDDAVTDVDC